MACETLTSLSPERLDQVADLAEAIVKRDVAGGIKPDLISVTSEIVGKLSGVKEIDVLVALSGRRPGKNAKKKQINLQKHREGQLKKQARLMTQMEELVGGLDIEDGAVPLPESNETKALRTIYKRLIANIPKTNDAQRLVALDQSIQNVKDAIDELDMLARDDFRNGERVYSVTLPFSGITVTSTDSEAKARVESQAVVNAKAQLKQLREELKIKEEIKHLESDLELIRQGRRTRPNGQPIFAANRSGNQQPPPSPELHDSKVKLANLKAEIQKEVRSTEHKMTPLEILEELFVNLPRNVMATADMSATLRQALVLSARPKNWGIAGRAFVNAWRSAWNTDTYENIYRTTKLAAEGKGYTKLGLKISGPDDAISLREEYFVSRWIDRIPVFGRIAEWSERHMNTILNSIRYEIVDRYVESAGERPSDAELGAYINYVNAATGRGDLNPGLARGLSPFFFAPRFVKSRFDVFLSAIGGKSPKPIREAIEKDDPFLTAKEVNKEIGRIKRVVAKEALRDIAWTVGMGLGAVGLASMAQGWDMGTDPEESDFGKLIIGNTRLDVFGGLQQVASLFLRAGAEGANTFELRKKTRDADFRDDLTRFLWYKGSPIMNTLMSALTGQDVLGNPTPAVQALSESYMPLLWSEVMGEGASTVAVAIAEQLDEDLGKGLDHFFNTYFPEKHGLWDETDKGMIFKLALTGAEGLGISVNTFANPMKDSQISRTTKAVNFQNRYFNKWPEGISEVDKAVWKSAIQEELAKRIAADPALRVPDNFDDLEEEDRNFETRRIRDLLNAERRDVLAQVREEMIEAGYTFN